jgi:predicted CopG family antitoxin
MPVQRTTVTVHADTHAQLEEERQKGETFDDAIQRLLEGEGA